jgi:hypothetical protein
MMWRRLTAAGVLSLLASGVGCAWMQEKGLWPESRQEDSQEIRQGVEERLDKLEKDFNELKGRIAGEEGESGEGDVEGG